MIIFECSYSYVYDFRLAGQNWGLTTCRYVFWIFFLGSYDRRLSWGVIGESGLRGINTGRFCLLLVMFVHIQVDVVLCRDAQILSDSRLGSISPFKNMYQYTLKHEYSWRMRNPANARLVLRLRFFIVSNFLFWININKESSRYYVWRRTKILMATLNYVCLRKIIKKKTISVKWLPRTWTLFMILPFEWCICKICFYGTTYWYFILIFSSTESVFNFIVKTIIW